MNIYKIMLLNFLFSSLYILGGERQKELDNLYKKYQDEHRSVIVENRDLLRKYSDRISDLCSWEPDSEQKAVLRNMKGKSIGMMLLSLMPLDANLELVELLQLHATVIKKALLSSKQNSELNFQFKIAADCLSRIVKRHLPLQKLDWAQEPPMHEKSNEEKVQHAKDLNTCKSKMLLERNQLKGLHGWLTFSLCSVAFFKAYYAFQKPSVVTGGLATVFTAWAGYHGYTYNRLNNLPAPSDIEVYKRSAICLNPNIE